MLSQHNGELVGTLRERLAGLSTNQTGPRKGLEIIECDLNRATEVSAQRRSSGQPDTKETWAVSPGFPLVISEVWG